MNDSAAGYLSKIEDELDKIPATSEVVTRIMMSEETLGQLRIKQQTSSPRWKGIQVLSSGPGGPFVRLYADGRIVEETMVEMEVLEAAE